MSDPTFQEMLDTAVEKAIIKHSRALEKTALDRERLYTVPELAKYSGFSEVTIRNWINQSHPKLPAFQVGKEYRVHLNVFLTWLEQYRVKNRDRVEELLDMRRAQS